MNVSIIIPLGPGEPDLEACLAGIAGQRYGAGRIDVLICGYAGAPKPARLAPDAVRWLEVDASGPYAARNLAASQAAGEILAFTESGCVAASEWVAEHVKALDRTAASISVGRVVPYRPTRMTDLFYSYEDARDEWIFYGDDPPSYFGRPKNMAISRARFSAHGPFREVQRGADSSFVQKVAREAGCEEIVFSPDAVVRQRSIRGIAGCFRDRFHHGHALQKHRSSHAAPIPLEERRRIFRETVRRRSYGPLSACALAALLVAGIAVFRFGGSFGNASRRRDH